MSQLGDPRGPEPGRGHVEPEGRSSAGAGAREVGRDESFPRSRRLLTEAQFRTLLARGFRHSTPRMVVHLLAAQAAESRLGLTVSRKVGGAVVRNRVRRRLREAFRRGWRFLLERPADVMIQAMPAAASATFAELERDGAEAIAAWRRSGYREGSRRPRGPRA